MYFVTQNNMDYQKNTVWLDGRSRKDNRDMTYSDILNEWAKYCEYDRNQNSFNLFSNSYKLHDVCKTIEVLLKEYDPTGIIATIYAKIQYNNLLKDTKISAWDMIATPEKYEDERKMYNLFNTPTVVNAENEFLNSLDNIYYKITEGKLIGEDKNDREKFLYCLENVVESINSCKFELFKKGGKIENLQNVSTKLQIFNTLAECLLTLEKGNDGIYFCFISANNTPDCFFSFFIKSNGNILSINDRVDEKYIGQHKNSRNGRWTNGKVDKIFPYDYIFNYSNHDYKGYATKYEVDEEKLDIYKLGIEVFTPIIVSMLLLVLKFTGKDIDFPLHYIDSFLPVNQERISNNGLMVIESSSLVCDHNNIDTFFDNEKILNGEYAEEFTLDSNNYNERGSFSNKNQLMVDLWADGFVYDPTKIFTNNNVACLIDKNTSEYTPEFIGSEKRMRLQIYKEIRKQLADYIEDKIYNEWLNCGKTEAIREWYKEEIDKNKEYLYKLFMEYEEILKDDERGTPYTKIKESNIEIYIETGIPYPVRANVYDIHNVKRDGYKWEYKCQENGKICNLWFILKPRNWKDVEFLVNEDVPKLVKGWNVNGHDSNGNYLLDVTDDVDRIKTPFEHIKPACYFGEYKYDDAYYDFTIAFGFSKSGWNKIKKKFRNK